MKNNVLKITFENAKSKEDFKNFLIKTFMNKTDKNNFLKLYKKNKENNEKKL